MSKYTHQDIKPYQTEKTKKQEVEEMFDNISGKYDFLNHLLSLNIDTLWRKGIVQSIKNDTCEEVLDVATGTGDLAIAIAKKTDAKVIGYDLSEKMLDVGRHKIQNLGMEDTIQMIKGDAEHIPFEDNRFDAITVAFGVRNFENLEVGLREMKRVLKPGKNLYILEFSKPEGLLAPIFMFYFKYILPNIGKLFSKDNAAYTYLPASVEAFPHGKEMNAILKSVGFATVSNKKLTFGIASIYEARK